MEIQPIGFRQQPVSLLLILATAAVDAVLLISEVDRLAIAVAGLAQVSVASITIIRGQAHRLARAGLAVTLLGCVKLLSEKGSDQLFPHLALFAAIQLAMLLACESVAAASRRRLGRRPLACPRFPVIELFGWPIIVAAATALLRSSAQMDPSEFRTGELVLLALGATAAYATVLIWERGLAEGILLGALATAAANFLLSPPEYARTHVLLLTLLHSGYVLLWIAAGRFDAQMASTCDVVSTSTCQTH